MNLFAMRWVDFVYKYEVAVYELCMVFCVASVGRLHTSDYLMILMHL